MTAKYNVNDQVRINETIFGTDVFQSHMEESGIPENIYEKFRKTPMTITEVSIYDKTHEVWYAVRENNMWWPEYQFVACE